MKYNFLIDWSVRSLVGSFLKRAWSYTAMLLIYADERCHVCKLRTRKRTSWMRPVLTLTVTGKYHFSNLWENNLTIWFQRVESALMSMKDIGSHEFFTTYLLIAACFFVLKLIINNWQSKYFCQLLLFSSWPFQEPFLKEYMKI